MGKGQHLLRESNREFELRLAKMTNLSPDSARALIRLYTAAIYPNFQLWLAYSTVWARHEEAVRALKSNLALEQRDNHQGMLWFWAKRCNALPRIEDFEYINDSVETIRGWAFNDRNRIGLPGTTVIATLENTSRIFMPVLAEASKLCGVKSDQYLDVHGEADADHAISMAAAVQYEMDSGYEEPVHRVEVSIIYTLQMLYRIFNV